MNFSVRLSAVITAAVLLTGGAGCGSSTSESGVDNAATDPSTSTATESPAPTESPSSTVTDSPSSTVTESSETPSSDTGLSSQTLRIGDSVDVGQAVIVSASNVDEPTTPVASELTDDRAIDTFVADMDPRLAEQVRAAAVRGRNQMQGDSTLYGSVVTVGCDKPVAVSWKITPEGVETTGQVPKTDVQCLVPVTSVAIFFLSYR